MLKPLRRGWVYRILTLGEPARNRRRSPREACPGRGSSGTAGVPGRSGSAFRIDGTHDSRVVAIASRVFLFFRAVIRPYRYPPPSLLAFLRDLGVVCISRARGRNALELGGSRLYAYADVPFPFREDIIQFRYEFALP